MQAKLFKLVLTLVFVMLICSCSVDEKSDFAENSHSSVIEESVVESSEESALDNADKKYKLTVENGLDLVNELENEYAEGETITLQLYTYTEHYFVVTVNGREIEMNREDSDLYYTYFYFTMPAEDAVVIIEDVYVDIPVAE